MQDEIAGLIAQNLKLKLGTSVPTAGGANAWAFEKLLLARHAMRREGAQDPQLAVNYYRGAIALEPENALAWAGLAEAYVLLARYSSMPAVEAMPLAREAAERARALAPDLAEVHAAIGWVRRTGDFDLPAAEAAFRQALLLAPQNPAIVHGSALVAANLGRVSEAIELERRALALDPLNPFMHAEFSLFLYMAGDTVAAEREMKVALKTGDGAGFWWHLVFFLIEQGKLDEAARAAALEPLEMERLTATALVQLAQGNRAEAERTKDRLISGFADRGGVVIATLYARMGDLDRGFYWLERAFAQHETNCVWLNANRYFQEFQGDARWPGILRKLGLADDQLK